MNVDSTPTFCRGESKLYIDDTVTTVNTVKKIETCQRHKKSKPSLPHYIYSTKYGGLAKAIRTREMACMENSEN